MRKKFNCLVPDTETNSHDQNSIFAYVEVSQHHLIFQQNLKANEGSVSIDNKKLHNTNYCWKRKVENIETESITFERIDVNLISTTEVQISTMQEL